MHPIFSSLLLLCLVFPLMGSRDAGSAKRLVGKTHSLLFFISDEKSEWSQLEKQQFLQLIRDAESWLTIQAKDYQQQITFDYGVFGWKKDIEMNDMPTGTRSGKENVRLTQEIITKLGYNTPQELLKRVKADNVQLLFLFKKDGISYAFPYEKHLDEEFYLEGMAIYHQFDPQTPQCAACIAHEILHLFGAWDYYKSFQTTTAQQDRATALYPNSIMLRTSYNMQELAVDPITAWRIGWIEQKPHGALFFQPQHP